MALSQKKQLLVTLGGSAVLAAGLGIYAWFGVFQVSKAEEAHEAEVSKLFALAPDEVTKLEVHAKDQTTRLELQDDEWRIVSPVQAKADQAAVKSLLGRLDTARRKKVVVEKDGSPILYGLDAPAVRIVGESASGKTSELALGNENTFDRSWFASVREGEILTASSSLKSALEKTTFDLRDKSVIVFGNDTLASIEAAGAATWSLQKEGDGWQLAGEPPEEADEKAVGGMLRALHDLRATAFPAAPAGGAAEGEAAGKEADPYGLEHPALTVTLERKGDAKALVLRLGTAGDKHYARVNDGPVAEVPAKILEDLTKTRADLRNHLVVAFDDAKVAQMKLATGDESFTVERKLEGGTPGDWALVAPESAEVKQWKMSSALSALHELRATTIVDAPEALSTYGLDTPVRIITVSGADDSALATLLVGKEEGDKTWVKSSASPRVFQVATSSLASLPKTAKEIENSPARAKTAAAAEAE